MAEENNGNNGQQRDAVLDNFSALSSDEMFADVVIPSEENNQQQEENKGENQEQNQEQNQDGQENTQSTENAEADPEKKGGEESDDNKQDEKSNSDENKQDEDTTTDIIEFKADDVEGFQSEPEDGTWLAVAKAMNLDVKEDSFEAYQEAVQAKIAEVEQKAKSITKEDIFASFKKPETAAALKLMEMGWSEEQVFAPTKLVDTYLAMDDAAIVRENYKALGWDDAKIDTEMEILAEKGWLEHEATKLRETLSFEKQEIIKQREAVLKQYEHEKEMATIRQREAETIQIQKALDTVSKFMNVSLSPDAKKAVFEKYSKGEYDQIVNNPQSKVELILFKEFGQKALKHIENTAYQRGREEKTKHLLNVPPVSSRSGKTVVPSTIQDNFKAIEEDFGN